MDNKYLLVVNWVYRLIMFTVFYLEFGNSKVRMCYIATFISLALLDFILLRIRGLMFSNFVIFNIITNVFLGAFLFIMTFLTIY